MKIVVNEAFRQHHAFIERIPALLAQRSECEVIYDQRNLVARFRHEGMTLIVKRYKKVNFIQQFVYTFFRKTKAERAYNFGIEFLHRGVKTPQPVAYMEEYRCGLFTTGYFVSQEAQGTETHLLLREVQDYPKDLAEAVASQIVSMHSKGILHGDLNLSNFLCTSHLVTRTSHLVPRTSHLAYSFTMIDTNRSHFCDGYPSNEACIKNMVRLTHRRDLYEDLIRRYARLRGWDADETARQALLLLDKFEQRRFRL